MPDAKTTRTSPTDSRTEPLHRAAGATGDEFLQYMFGMVLLYLDTRTKGTDQPVEEPAECDPQVARAAKMLTRKHKGR